MDKFTETFCDDFSGELNANVWSGHYQYGNTTEARKGSYWNKNLAYTENGNLVSPVTYLQDGMGGKGAGWYTAGRRLFHLARTTGISICGQRSPLVLRDQETFYPSQ